MQRCNATVTEMSRMSLGGPATRILRPYRMVPDVWRALLSRPAAYAS